VSKKILIICFSFPPNPGIGGRRWAKFAKLLNEPGHDVRVIGKKPTSSNLNSSNWESDTETYIDRIQYIPTTYPEILRTVPLTILAKLKYRLALLWVKGMTNANYFDHSNYWSDNLLSVVENQIEDGVQIVIASGGPFRYLFDLCQLKTKYSNVKFYADFRDPWTTNQTAFGFETLSLRRQKNEMNMERIVVNSFDGIISVAEQMNDHFRTLVHGGSSTRFMALPNGFDPDDFDSLGHDSSHDKLRFVFSGTIYRKSEYLLEAFIEAIELIALENKMVGDQLEVVVAGKASPSAIRIMERSEKVEFLDVVTQEQSFSSIMSATIAMLFLTDDLNYSFSTKFCEYLAMNKPIIVFSKRGYTGEYVERNSIGYYGGDQVMEMKEKILFVYQKWKTNSISFPPSSERAKFDVGNLTTRLLDFIEEGPLTIISTK
jgi:glycosyltransferase involved in cell wall biosynthesis